jgi:hypothetical protein
MAREKNGAAPKKNTAMDRELTLDLEMDKAAAIEALAELYELLEDYGPSWYSEELHHRAEAALRILRESHQ